MRWAIAVVVIAGFLFAANFVFIVKPVRKAPPAGPPRIVPQTPTPPPPPPPPASLTTGVITGRVLTAEEGKPVAGARIDVEGHGPGVATGPDGSFRAEEISAGKWTVTATSAEYTEASGHVEIAPGKSAAVDLFVLAGASIEGRIVTGGGPLPGAVVREVRGTRSATSGKDGTFVLRGFRPGDQKLRVTAAGFLAQEFWVEVEPGKDRATCTLEMRLPWRVTGTVLSGGKPVAGARVAPTFEGIANPDFAGPVTADDGTFVLESVDDLKEAGVWAWKDGLGLACSEAISKSDGITRDGVVIAFLPAEVVTITCFNEAGAPVPGAVLRAVLHPMGPLASDVWAFGDDRDPPPTPGARTDDKGQAVLPLQPGAWNIEVSAEGYCPEEAGMDLREGEPPPAVEVTLKRGKVLEGRVVDGEGSPLEGVSVSVGWKGPYFDTGADGRFRFPNVPDEDQVVFVTKEGFSRGPTEGARPGTPLTIVMRPASTIRGRVLLADGKTPARAFTVNLWFEATEDGKPWKDQGWSFRTDEVTDAEGRFACSGIEPGTIGVEAVCGDLVSPRVSVETRPGTDPKEVALVLRKGASIAGQVRGSGGHPVRGIRVGLSAPWTGQHPPQDGEDWAHVRDTAADADGKFEFRLLQPGRYKVKFEDNDFIEREFEVRVAAGTETRADAVLGKGGHLEVECMDGAGQPVEWDLMLFLEDEGEVEKSVTYLGEWGSYESNLFSPEELSTVRGIAPGAYRARLTARGCNPAEVRVVVKEGQTTTVKATLKRIP